MHTEIANDLASQIDFNTFGAEYGELKLNAARMRFYRLRETIETKKGGTTNGKRESAGVEGKATPKARTAKKAAKKAIGGSPPQKRKVQATCTEDSDVAEGVAKAKSE